MCRHGMDMFREYKGLSVVIAGGRRGVLRDQ